VAPGTQAVGRLTVTYPLLLDEMFSDEIAEQLRAKGHDVRSVVADHTLVALPDDQILIEATAAGRALVTANIKDFVPLDVQYKAMGRTTAGLVLVSTKTFPQGRSFVGAIISALDTLLAKSVSLADRVVFLER
jgi:hypothetical protein